ncbi:MAG: hypothetical protein H8D45_18035 [Bacteroidetes bacterium]|nr:hypothetical protein [Bacteroidota bacterium]
MKKYILLLLGLLLSVSLLALDRTRTIEETDFSAIQAACAGGDDIINHYYQLCVDNAVLLREDWEPPEDDMGLRTDYGTSFYANKAFVGAVGELQYPWQAEAKLREASYFTVEQDPNGLIHQLSIANDVIPYLTKPEDYPYPNIPDATPYRKGLDIGYTLENLALIVDMLWWYEGHGIYQIYLLPKLTINNLTNLKYLFYFTQMEHNKYFG